MVSSGPGGVVTLVTVAPSGLKADISSGLEVYNTVLKVTREVVCGKLMLTPFSAICRPGTLGVSVR